MPKRETHHIPDSAKPFNPLAKSHLAQSVAEALLGSEKHALPPVTKFPGAGVYVIYYSGPDIRYAPLVAQNLSSEIPAPLYVGKAVPSGARKGRQEFDTAIGHSLFKRLFEHADSIKAAENLSLRDFRCQFLVVDDIWIPLAESLLIDKFKPVWNVLIDGFGNHDPGSGRYQQKQSPWDILHPGRKWAERLQSNTKSLAAIEAEIISHFTKTLK